MAHDSPLLKVSVPDINDAADVTTHLETIVEGIEKHAIVECTSGARPTSPPAGLTIYETDTRKVLQWHPSISQWRPPWSQPWGMLGITMAQPDSSDPATYGAVNTSTWAQVNNLTVPVAAGRCIRVVLSICAFGNYPSPGLAVVQFKLTGGATDTRLQGTPVVQVVDVGYLLPGVNIHGYEQTTVTENRKYAWWNRLTSGPAVNFAKPLTLSVEDCGPAITYGAT